MEDRTVRGRKLNRIGICAALLVLCGCSPSSILSDVSQHEYWLPSRTSFGEFAHDYKGETLRFVFRDGRVVNGVLLNASRDSMVWMPTDSPAIAHCRTQGLAYIKHASNVVPTVACLTVCVFFFDAMVWAGAQTDASHGNPRNLFVPLLVGGCTGALLGYGVGQSTYVGPEFIVEPDSLRMESTE